MSSYLQAKNAFPDADLYVVASNDTKVRPIPFDDKKFLAQQAGVADPFVQVAAPINPKEVLQKYNPETDIFILVRSERDPVGYTKKDGTPGYFQPFVALNKCEPFGKHGYVFVSKKHVFDIGGVEIYSGSQVRSLFAKANPAGKQELINGLYPRSQKKGKILQIFNKYLSGAVNEAVDHRYVGMPSVRTWMNQVRREHGPEVKFFNKKASYVDTIVAYNNSTPDRKIVGSYNRNTNNGTVFAPDRISEADEVVTKPIKPFSQVKQFPLDALLTGHGDGTELKADPEYRRETRRNKQVVGQRNDTNDRVKDGYPADDHDQDWDDIG
jgi:hypothetical protein